MTIRDKLRTYREELPNALLLATLTAVVTLILAMLISVVLGGEQRELLRRAVSNGEEVVQHSAITRCELAYLVELVKVIGEQSPQLDLEDYPTVNTDGLDCEAVISQPFDTVDPQEEP